MEKANAQLNTPNDTPPGDLVFWYSPDLWIFTTQVIKKSLKHMWAALSATIVQFLLGSKIGKTMLI